MIANVIRRATRAVAASCVCILIVTGCKTAPAPEQRVDYSQTLNKYYEGRPMCVWPDTVQFPVEDATPGQMDERGFNALADAGLLVSKPAGKGAPKGSKTFDLSPAGRSALDPDVFKPGAGNFCYGRRKVVSIDAARRNSATTELVSYHYSVAQPAAWATGLSIHSAFAPIAAELLGTHPAVATMLDTTDGWEISGAPSTVAPPAATHHTPALVKAITLLAQLRKTPTY